MGWMIGLEGSGKVLGTEKGEVVLDGEDLSFCMEVIY